MGPENLQDQLGPWPAGARPPKEGAARHAGEESPQERHSRSSALSYMGCEATLGCNFSIPRLLVPKDWGGIQGGRLRAMMALCIRMTKRTTSARRGVASTKKLATDSVVRIVLSRSEEMQAIKNFIASLPAFQASRCLKLCHPANVQPVPSGTPSCKRAQGYGTRWRSSACHLSHI